MKVISKMEDIFEKLEKYGSISIMEKEDGDYMIIVKPKDIDQVKAILDSELGKKYYCLEYNAKFDTFEIDFNVRGREIAEEV